MTNRVLTITNLYLDFELGAHKAAIEISPQVNIIGCRFHLGQAWWRKKDGLENMLLAVATPLTHKLFDLIWSIH
ncbi:hypothetical protein ACI65C_005867 [Semiaphis heraclei]